MRAPRREVRSRSASEKHVKASECDEHTDEEDEENKMSEGFSQPSLDPVGCPDSPNDAESGDRENYAQALDAQKGKEAKCPVRLLAPRAPAMKKQEIAACRTKQQTQQADEQPVLKTSSQLTHGDRLSI